MELAIIEKITTKKYSVLYSYNNNDEKLSEFIDLFKSLKKKRNKLFLCIIKNVTDYTNLSNKNISIRFHLWLKKIKQSYSFYNELNNDKWCIKYKQLRGKKPTYESYVNKNLIY